MTLESLPNPMRSVKTDSSTLCTNCGLCCMGALHFDALLYPDEVDSARAQGLEIADGDRPAFALPCPKLVGTSCSIFASRPRVCGGYKCQLLLDLEGGATTLDNALATVGAARDLFEQAHTSGPPSGESDLAANRLRLNRTALALYLDKNFMNSTDRKILEMMVVGTPAIEPET